VRIALDTNVLVYAEGVNGEIKKAEATQLLAQISPKNVVIPVQTLLELFNVLIRKSGLTKIEAQLKVAQWVEGYQTTASTSTIMFTAMDIAARHGFQIFDAVILAAAAEAQCSLLLSEDMHDGFTWHGVTVANPFKPNPHVLLQLLLTSES